MYLQYSIRMFSLTHKSHNYLLFGDNIRSFWALSDAEHLGLHSSRRMLLPSSLKEDLEGCSPSSSSCSLCTARSAAPDLLEAGSKDRSMELPLYPPFPSLLVSPGILELRMSGECVLMP